MNLSTIRHKDLFQWIKDNPQLEKELKDQGKCTLCSGTGVHTCECMDVHDCGECDGTGNACGNIEAALRLRYQRQKKEDLAKLIKYLSLLSKEEEGQP